MLPDVSRSLYELLSTPALLASRSCYMQVHVMTSRVGTDKESGTGSGRFTGLCSADESQQVE